MQVDNRYLLKLHTSLIKIKDLKKKKKKFVGWKSIRLGQIFIVHTWCINENPQWKGLSWLAFSLVAKTFSIKKHPRSCGDLSYLKTTQVFHTIVNCCLVQAGLQFWQALHERFDETNLHDHFYEKLERCIYFRNEFFMLYDSRHDFRLQKS